ncbi:hypothetical protein BT69DRAFT_1284195 [Atractiella rhizophila]|nr:hypothetical protein BT69DRAFT_1284195 [Atractiella rhizophila]
MGTRRERGILADFKVGCTSSVHCFSLTMIFRPFELAFKELGTEDSERALVSMELRTSSPLTARREGGDFLLPL